MKPFNLSLSRRSFLGKSLGATGLALGGVFYTVRGAFAEQVALARTPSMTEGPFYPDKLPLDTDNDLIIIKDSLTPAVGAITHLTGRVLSTSGEPIKDATVEIWQCDNNAVYLNTRDSLQKKDQQDKNFQGFGKFLTGNNGEYRFRTIKPVPYPGRPAGHIHFKVKKGDRTLLTSQIFIAGFPGNKNDGIFNDVGDVFERELVQADFKPVKDSRIGEYAARFDIVVGLTPQDRQR